MARPRLPIPKVFNTKLYLRTGVDDDLIEFFEAVPRKMRAKAVMQALRSGKLNLALLDIPADDEAERALEALMS